MLSNEVRSFFINYFKKLGHDFVPSTPIISYHDPSLMFSNAGMNQFKNIFLDVDEPKWKRVANAQKCMRVSGKHNDLEDVGKDTTHQTFFEMLGNWSFGDYYKAEAIEWAWNLITKEWQLPKDRLWATVYQDDDEAETLWKKITNISPSHILRFGAKENFWEMADTGPCGPCSEIHIDLGEDKDLPGKPTSVNEDGSRRFIEIWNLVFIQYNRQADGQLKPLLKKHIDTGMGFERIVALLQNKTSNYDTDVFQDMIKHMESICRREYYSSDDVAQIPFRVIADHIRAVSICIADGGLPSNEGRGYVIRRLLRRAIRYATKLDIHEPILYQLVQTVVNKLGEAYPELRQHQVLIEKTIKQEEETFGNTLTKGIEIFEDIITQLERKGIRTFPGDQAFKLYDTFGFPVDLTALMATEKGYQMDKVGFDVFMDEQRHRSRSSSSFVYQVDQIDWTYVAKDLIPTFVGYNILTTQTSIVKYAFIQEQTQLVVLQTPFYGESGGQTGDKGTLQIDGKMYPIIDTQKKDDEMIHYIHGILPEDLLKSNPMVTLQVDPLLRNDAARNHTATHLLHTALRSFLGDHITQQGSLVSPDRLRFDFNHFEKIDSEKLTEIETYINQKIWENLPVKVFETSLEQAREKGIIALFGEKYGETVRVIEIETYSKELCGGTHVTSTGSLGLFKILFETSSASGVRRIEAITGRKAFEKVQENNHILKAVMQLTNAQLEKDVVTKVQHLITEKKSLEKEIQSLQVTAAADGIQQLMDQSVVLGSFKVVRSSVEVGSVDELRRIGDEVRNRLKSGIGILTAKIEDKHSIICVITDDLIKEKQMHAGKLVQEIAQLCEGSGGGKPHQAIAGIKAPHKIKDALDQSIAIIQSMVP